MLNLCLIYIWNNLNFFKKCATLTWHIFEVGDHQNWKTKTGNGGRIIFLPAHFYTYLISWLQIYFLIIKTNFYPLFLPSNNFFLVAFPEVGVSTLKQLALTKGNFVPTLNALVPYLDHTANQEYLRKRIKGNLINFCGCHVYEKH